MDLLSGYDLIEQAQTGEISQKMDGDEYEDDFGGETSVAVQSVPSAAVEPLPQKLAVKSGDADDADEYSNDNYDEEHETAENGASEGLVAAPSDNARGTQVDAQISAPSEPATPVPSQNADLHRSLTPVDVAELNECLLLMLESVAERVATRSRPSATEPGQAQTTGVGVVSADSPMSPMAIAVDVPVSKSFYETTSSPVKAPNVAPAEPLPLGGYPSDSDSEKEPVKQRNEITAPAPAKELSKSAPLQRNLPRHSLPKPVTKPAVAAAVKDADNNEISEKKVKRSQHKHRSSDGDVPLKAKATVTVAKDVAPRVETRTAKRQQVHDTARKAELHAATAHKPVDDSVASEGDLHNKSTADAHSKVRCRSQNCSIECVSERFHDRVCSLCSC